MTVGLVKVLTAVMATVAMVPETGAAPVIAVVSRSETDPVMVAALNRFRGEAAAVGFAVTLVPVRVGTAPAVEMEIAARVVPAVATVNFVHGDDPAGLDVWFMDRQDGQTVVDHVTVESNADDRALVVAVKSVDVLRARLYGLLARSGREPPPPAESSVALPAPGPPTRPDVTAWRSASAFGVSLGLGVVRSVQGLGTSLLLLVRGAYDITSRNALRLTFGGLGTRSTVDAPPTGQAKVRETLVALEWILSPWNRRVQPMLAAGAGAHYFSVDGVANDPAFRGGNVHHLVGAAGLALGAHAFLSRHFAVCLEAGAFWLFPPVEVAVAGNNPQRTGQPALLGTLTLEARP